MLDPVEVEQAWRWLHLQGRWLRGRGRGCDVCGSLFLGPVLRHDLWDSLCTNPREMLCEPCIEGRLQGPLHPHDFLPCPWNAWRNSFKRLLRECTRELASSSTHTP